VASDRANPASDILIKSRIIHLDTIGPHKFRTTLASSTNPNPQPSPYEN